MTQPERSIPKGEGSGGIASAFFEIVRLEKRALKEEILREVWYAA